MLPRQITLLGREPPGFDAGFAQRRRVQLDAESWVDVVPGWVRGHEELFEVLARTTEWQQQSRVMYDRTVEVPRLFAALPEHGPGHPLLEPMRVALGAAYDVNFERITVALYRDGRDSVAWHGDYVAREMPRADVATVALGAPRRFLLRPKGGGKSMAFSSGWGDLMVMGGACQRTWEHSIPKVAAAEPRLVVMFRPRWEQG